MAHNVKCKVCGKTFDRDKEKAVKVDARRYAHAACAEGYQPSEDEINLAKLHAYLKELFKGNYSYLPLQKQIEGYVKDQNFTYTGILKSLIYFYEIKGNSLELSNNRIGIVPYVYNEARDYYYELFLRNQLNEGKNLDEFKNPEVIEVRIKIPEKQLTKFRLFNLDD